MKESVHILVVDDSPNWLDIYQEALADSGFDHVQTAPDLETALDCLNKQLFHVAVVDIRLGEERENRQGLQVLERIWGLDEGTRVIISSAYATADMLSDFINKQVFAFSSRQDVEGLINGTIDKTDSIVKSLNKVEQAVREARRDVCKKKWLTSPTRFFKGLSGRQMQTSLKGMTMTELRPFLGDLCRPLFPWLHSDRDAQFIVDNASSDDPLPFAVEGFAWSRSCGKPVVARFARKDRFDESLQVTPAGKAYGFECEEEITRLSSAHLRGKVWTVAGISFEDAFTSLPSKRIDKSNMPSHA